MDISVLERALEREKARRKKAEQLLEDKSRELFHSYESLESSHKSLEQAMHEVKVKQRQLIQSEKMASLGVMSAGVAHEINNPLAFVMCNLKELENSVKDFNAFFALVNNLLNSTGDEEQTRNKSIVQSYTAESDLEFLFEDSINLVTETLDGADRVKNIVAGLKAFTREDSGAMETVDINNCLEGTVKLASNQIKDGCKVISNFGEITPISGFPGKLGQVFLNLILNANQAITDEGTITLETFSSQSSVTIRISDTGSGMSPETIDSIFTPFFTTKPVGEGTGLGMSISHGIVEEHSGEILVESTLGEGSVFSVVLPIAPIVYD